jgi:hypothetical protein
LSLHPGAILETDLGRNYDPEKLKLVVARARRVGGFETMEQGAATTVWCATSSQLDGLGGAYCENCDIAPVKTVGDDGRPGDRTAAVGVERALAAVTHATAAAHGLC